MDNSIHFSNLNGFPSGKFATRKVSCQYDLAAVKDLSPDHELNKNNNTWHVGKFLKKEALKNVDLVHATLDSRIIVLIFY